MTEAELFALAEREPWAFDVLRRLCADAEAADVEPPEPVRRWALRVAAGGIKHPLLPGQVHSVLSTRTPKTPSGAEI